MTPLIDAAVAQISCCAHRIPSSASISNPDQIQAPINPLPNPTSPKKKREELTQPPPHTLHLRPHLHLLPHPPRSQIRTIQRPTHARQLPEARATDQGERDGRGVVEDGGDGAAVHGAGSVAEGRVDGEAEEGGRGGGEGGGCEDEVRAEDGDVPAGGLWGGGGEGVS